MYARDTNTSRREAACHASKSPTSMLFSVAITACRDPDWSIPSRANFLSHSDAETSRAGICAKEPSIAGTSTISVDINSA